ncbi:MAG: CDP-glucose 4,6-dehydratase [Desulfobacterales bacterium]|nr:MAG: CDP-glucose 4,6-dehydratase [Desulfobacterales bacterium]
MFNDVYRKQKVFVTGNTGFKGSWLVLWLSNLGAHVGGYALEPPTQPNHYDLLALSSDSVRGDIRDAAKVRGAVQSFKPDIVFHLAAQSLVRRSYRDPAGTFTTNVMGTVNVLEACRQTEGVKAIVNVSSDKCYENQEWIWGYREADPVGGHDPYSASKGCAEITTACYRRSFFPVQEYQKTHQCLVASVRAGNVIGGGDWGEDRLVPDIMRAAHRNVKVLIRNPQATRPWQHVLEPLAGYLLLGQQLLEGKQAFAGAWNFGPDDQGHKRVLAVVQDLQNFWSAIDFRIALDEKKDHEAHLLKLDCSKARAQLGWRPVWSGPAMFEKTVHWYREFYESKRVCSREQLAEYIHDAQQKSLSWVVP